MKSKLLTTLAAVGLMAVAGVAFNAHTGRLVDVISIRVGGKIYGVEQGCAFGSRANPYGTKVQPVGSNYRVVDTNRDDVADVTVYAHPFSYSQEVPTEAQSNLFSRVIGAYRASRGTK